MSRAAYEALARSSAAQYGLPEGGFLALVEYESDWDPNAVSMAGAVGLTQLMPAAALQTGVIQTSPAIVEEYLERYPGGAAAANAWLLDEPIEDMRMQPAASLDGGARYLAWLAYDFLPEHIAAGEDVWPAALAAYNWGPGNISYNLEDHGGYLNREAMPAATQDYLAQLLPAFAGAVQARGGGPPWMAIMAILMLAMLMWQGGKRL